MSQMHWKFLKALAPASLVDAAVVAGDTLLELVWKLQGQADGLKARAGILEMNTQGNLAIDLSGYPTSYNLSASESQNPMLTFNNGAASLNVYLNESTNNPALYWLYNGGSNAINFIAGGTPAITVLQPGRWTTISYAGTTSSEVRIDKISTGDKGDILVSSDSLTWTIDSGSVTYAKLATALQTLINGKEATANKGVANGYAPLGSDSKIDAAYLPASLAGGMTFKGTWNATTNVVTSSDVALNGNPIPAASSGNNGYYFIVATAGSTSIGGITDWKVGDWVISYGTAWTKIDNTDAVASVNGATGTVVLNTDNISESGSPTNLWFTTARAVAAITVTTMGNLISGATGKATPVNADSLLMSDSAAANVGKKVLFSDFKTTLAAYFVTLYLSLPPTNGMVVRTSASTAVSRTLTGTANQIEIANGDGTGGNPTFSTPSTFIAPGSIKATTTLEVGAAGSNFSGWIVQFTANLNGYSQTSHQNKSAGASASGDVVITTDTGTDTTEYIDLGINGSGYSDVNWTMSGAKDGYLYTASGHLSVGTAAAKDLILHTGGTLAANIRLRIMSDGEWRLNNGASGNSDEVLTCKGANQKPVWQVPTLATYNFITTTDYNVTSTSYAVVNAAVRLTGLPAGKYLTICVAQLAADNSDVDAWLGIHCGTSGSTTLCTGAEVPVRPTQGVTLYPTYRYEIPVTVFGYGTITAGQVIEPKVKSASGGIDILNCSLTAIRIG